MSVPKLIKLMPTLILVGTLGYSVSAIQSGLPGAGESRAEVQKGIEQMMQDLVAEGSGAATKLEGKLRDPFWATVAATAPQEAAARELSHSPEADPLAEFVRGLTLDATFLQGRDQLAVINGRMYSRGQRLNVPGEEAVPGQGLQVFAVTRTGVLLKGGGKSYMLGYPDQLGKKKDKDGESDSAREQMMAEIDPAGQMEAFQRLLSSPLGAMGKGLIGNPASADRRSGAAAGTPARRRSDARARGSGAGGP
jgi:hypothetical protein